MNNFFKFYQFDNTLNICYNRQCALKKRDKKQYRRIFVKNILKRILVFSIVLLLSISNANGIEIRSIMTTHKLNKKMEIYEVRSKDEIIISDSIVNFYETDSNKEEILKYIEEQRRLEKERLEKINLRNNLVNFAKQFVGNPYVMGGTSLTHGADCSGFVQTVFASFGIYVPRSTGGQAISGIAVSIENIEPGDIISYGYNGVISHSAIYIGNEMVIHASTPELGIRIDTMHMMELLGIRRVI